MVGLSAVELCLHLVSIFCVVTEAGHPVVCVVVALLKNGGYRTPNKDNSFKIGHNLSAEDVEAYFPVLASLCFL
jgi:hypothetical protein